MKTCRLSRPSHAPEIPFGPWHSELAKRIVEGLGGTIQAESRPGTTHRGGAFWST